MNLLDIRHNETGKVVLTWSMNALLAIGYTIGWAAVHSMLVKRVGVAYLPYTYIGVSILGMIGSSVYMLFADSVRRDRLLIMFSLATGLVLLSSRLLVSERNMGEAALTPELLMFFILILLGQGLGNSTLGTQVWTIIGDVFRPAQSRRLIPIIATSGTIGGILGGISIHTLVESIGTANLVLIWGGATLLLIPLTLALRHYYGGELRGGQVVGKKEQPGMVDNLKQGYGYILTSPLIRSLSVIAVLFWLVGSLQDYQYTHIMNETFPSEEALTRYYGYYGIAFNFTAMLLQFGIARHLTRYLGVARGLVALPLTIFCGFALILSFFTFIPGLIMRYSWDIIGMVIQGNSFHLAFSAVPNAIRGRVRGFIDGIVNPVGGIIGGVVILILQHLFVEVKATQYVISVTGLILAVLWVIVGLRVKRNYTQSVLHNLTSDDRQTVLSAIESLEERGNPVAVNKLLEIVESTEKEICITAMVTLARLDHLPALRPISRLLHHDDEDIRLEAVKAIQTFNGIEQQPFLKHYFQQQMHILFSSDESPPVRARAAGYLIKDQSPEETPAFVQQLLGHSDTGVRSRIIETMLDLKLHYSDFILEPMLRDPDPKVCATAVVALWPVHERRVDLQNTIKRLLQADDSEAQRAGLQAIIKVGEFDVKYVAPLLNHDHPQVNCAAALACLAVSAPSELWDSAVEIILDAMTDPTRLDELKRDVIPNLPNLQEETLDAILIGAAMLPPEKRCHATELLQSFHSIFNRAVA